MSDASDRGWGPGWPNCQSGTIATLTRPDGLRLPLRREILPLVAWLIDETERRGYDVHPNETWGYACRPIRGYQKPSNHSWGLAIDINAPANPMLHGVPGWKALHTSGRTDMPEWMPALWKLYGFRWGGDYRSRQDAMHYEFMGTPADAARYIAKIQAPPVKPAWKPPAYPGHVLKVGEVTSDVATLKQLLVDAGYGQTVNLRGPGAKVFGVGTRAAVKRAQADAFRLDHSNRTPTGDAGPATWKYLVEVAKIRQAA
ncbi:MAG TPA: M15 family metallopeptidase [Microthrixaceae bacterium]|nr:M15 family metallopeptidase [Microthrixaceae bacterium]HNH38647.1 M15 family metallopeptidase [Microthrixaceae bacterium]